MRDETGYIVERSWAEWTETGIAIERTFRPLQTRLLKRLEEAVRVDNRLALAVQNSFDGVHWFYEGQRSAGSHERVILLRKDTRQAKAAAIEIAECLVEERAYWFTLNDKATGWHGSDLDDIDTEGGLL